MALELMYLVCFRMVSYAGKLCRKSIRVAFNTLPTHVTNKVQVTINLNSLYIYFRDKSYAVIFKYVNYKYWFFIFLTYPVHKNEKRHLTWQWNNKFLIFCLSINFRRHRVIPDLSCTRNSGVTFLKAGVILDFISVIYLRVSQIIFFILVPLAQVTMYKTDIYNKTFTYRFKK